MFPGEIFIAEGISVSSGVSDQPMSDQETLTGALNRAANAKNAVADADYWAGVEGGIEKKENEMTAYAWVVIHTKDHFGKARTGAFFLPPKVAKLIDEGKELGEADDIVFGHTNSKQKGGALGLLTHSVIDRTSLYVEAVIMALIPFKNKHLY